MSSQKFGAVTRRESVGKQFANGCNQIAALRKDFILEFRLDNSYIYRYGAPCTFLIASDQLQTNIVAKRYFLDVNVEHLIMANEHLADKLKNEPASMLPLVYSEDIVLMSSLRMQ